MAKKLNPKQSLQTFLKDYLFPTASVIVLILVFSLVTIPSITKIQETSEIINAKKEEIKGLETFLGDLKKLSETESVIVADNLIMDQYLPEDSRVSSLIDDIDFLAELAGLSAIDLVGHEAIKAGNEIVEDEDEDEVLEKPKRVLIEFNYVGTFDEVYQLFEEINAFKGLLSVESVSFSGRQERWDVEIMVASYNLPDVVLESIVEGILDRSGTHRIEFVNERVLNLVKLRIQE